MSIKKSMAKYTLKYGVAIALLFSSYKDTSSNDLIVINDINNALTKENILKITTIIEKKVAFHSSHIKIPRPLILPIRIFKSKQKYKNYQRNISKSSKSINGFYSASKKEIIINKNRNLIRVVLHEAQHLIFRSGFQHPPKWINEGLSEFYETAYIFDKDVFVKAQTHKRMRLQNWLLEGDLPKLSTFLSLSNKNWKAENKTPNFKNSTMSWGLIYFLMSTQEGKKTISNTILELKKDSDRTSLMALDKYYIGGLYSLEKDFHSFLTKMPVEQKI